MTYERSPPWSMISGTLTLSLISCLVGPLCTSSTILTAGFLASPDSWPRLLSTAPAADIGPGGGFPEFEAAVLLCCVEDWLCLPDVGRWVAALDALLGCPDVVPLWVLDADDCSWPLACELWPWLVEDFVSWDDCDGGGLFSFWMWSLPCVSGSLGMLIALGGALLAWPENEENQDLGTKMHCYYIVWIYQFTQNHLFMFITNLYINS